MDFIQKHKARINFENSTFYVGKKKYRNHVSDAKPINCFHLEPRCEHVLHIKTNLKPNSEFILNKVDRKDIKIINCIVKTDSHGNIITKCLNLSEKQRILHVAEKELEFEPLPELNATQILHINGD